MSIFDKMNETKPKPRQEDMSSPHHRVSALSAATRVTRFVSGSKRMIALAGFLLPAVLAEAASRDPARPNIIFVLTDDMAWADFGAAGNPYVRTPNLDRMAAEGTRFDLYSVSPVCSPSRTGFLTGQFPARLGIHGHIASPKENAARRMPNALPASSVVLPSMMRDAGYYTVHIGKWHLQHSIEQAFVSQAGRPALFDAQSYGFDSFYSRFHFDRMLSLIDAGLGTDYLPYQRAHSTPLYVQQAIRELRESGDRPVMINLWTLVPHTILKPTPEELAVYAGKDVDPEAFPEPMRSYIKAAKNPAEQMRVYAAAMTGLDRQIGVLLDAIREQGLAESTLVIFTSDNGPEDYTLRGIAGHEGMGSPAELRGRKRSIYEGGVRMPLIAWWPGRVPAGAHNKSAVLAAVDLVPTLATIAGAKLPAGYAGDGEDVSDLLLGGEPRPRQRPIFWEWRFEIFGNARNKSPTLSVRDGPWRFYMNADRSSQELYRVTDDPGENRNVAEAQPKVASRLADLLAAWKSTLPK